MWNNEVAPSGEAPDAAEDQKCCNDKRNLVRGFESTRHTI
jgi:hypothetical protein